jgi:hypothetical protein
MKRDLKYRQQQRDKRHCGHWRVCVADHFISAWTLLIIYQGHKWQRETVI